MDLKIIVASALGSALFLTPVHLLSAAAEDTPSVLYFGDVNLDGEIDVLDIVSLQKHLLGQQPLKDESVFVCADLNDDKSVDIFDLGLLKQKVISDRQNREDGQFIVAPLREFYGSMPSQGGSRMMVFYVDFPDCKYEYEPSLEEINSVCFGYNNDTKDPNYPFTSLRSFFFRASKGVMDLNGKAFRYTAKNPITYYQVNDSGEKDDDKIRLMTEIFQYYNRFVDFSEFDSDKDGLIDNILVNVPKSASEDHWWPCSGQNYSNLEADGVKIGHTTIGHDQIASETDHREFVSTYVHETGHTMGLPDYYLYHSEDIEGFHGNAGTEMMDSDNYSDFGCFSKLMLGWYRENQIQVYDTAKGGEQTFLLKNAQTTAGNCLILPCGELDGNFNSEFMIFEFNTDQQNNSGINRDKTAEYGFSVASGVRGFHIQAKAIDREGYRWLYYQTSPNMQVSPDSGIRLIRLINDAEGGSVFKTGDVIDGNISGFHWYASDESETVGTGYTVKIGELLNGAYTVTVSHS